LTCNPTAMNNHPGSHSSASVDPNMCKETTHWSCCPTHTDTVRMLTAAVITTKSSQYHACQISWDVCWRLLPPTTWSLSAAMSMTWQFQRHLSRTRHITTVTDENTVSASTKSLNDNLTG